MSGVIGLGAGIVLTYLVFPNNANNKPFNINDAKSILAKLKPISYKQDRTSAYIYLWGDGKVNISVELDYSSKMKGEGNSLEEAIDDLKSKSLSVEKALR